MHSFRLVLIIATFLLIMVAPATALPTQEDLQQKVDDARKEAGLVALGAVVANSEGEILGLAVSGERRKGSADPALPEDAWHIGSNTKMLTALLYGRLVEQGEAEWGATLPELLPDLVDGMDPAWTNITIEHLLAHRSGLRANPGTLWFMMARSSKEDAKSQRTSLAEGFLAEPPSGTPGKFEYSNLGYMIVGAVLDRIAMRLGEQDYESLLLTRLVPDREGWGFGPPPEGIEGHAEGFFGLKPRGKGLGADNPPALAPAGTLHVPLAAHARFLSDFLAKDDTEAKLLRPFPDTSSDYALGWIVDTVPDFGTVYAHNGSNTMWTSSVRVFPDDGLVVIVNSNSYSKDAAAAIVALNFQLARLYAEESPPEQ
jgi:CubicO group peptidase (beta-lactamase class C family)